VIELHGALAEVGCLACGATEERDSLQVRMRRDNDLSEHLAARASSDAPDGDAEVSDAAVDRFVIPACLSCGGTLKPRVVFFGDSVPRAVVDDAFARVEAADALLIAGTSLAVFSGYRFLLRAAERGKSIAIINRGAVRGEERATLKIEASTGATLDGLARELAGGR
jgi:NAD-dependent SIR2 family protein deacetylase